MEIKDIKRLLDAVAAADVSEFAYETGDFKLSVKRGSGGSVAGSPLHSSGPSGDRAAVEMREAATAAAALPSSPPSRPDSESSYIEVIAPIVGTFYAAAGPDSDPFVRVGDRVQAGTVLCIIEAMKLMNEIEAETVGTVAEVLVSDEEPVEYGQVLFRIDPG